VSISHLGRTAFLAVVIATPVCGGAQLCYGTPRNGGIAFEHGRVNFGSTNGVSGAISAAHLALAGGYRKIEIGSNVTGNSSEGRFAIVLGGSRVQFCPAIGAEYETRAWDAGTAGILNSRHLTGRAGAGLGIEQSIVGGVSLIPYAAVQFAYTAIDYKLDRPNSNVQEVGDTTSTGDVEYGLLARYKILYGGFSARHAMKSAPPYFARWIVGVTFPTGGGGGGGTRR
jgi:hypothetical protein